MEEVYYGYNPEEILNIEQVEESLIILKKFFKDNINGAIDVKQIKRIINSADKKIDNALEYAKDPSNIEGREDEFQDYINELAYKQALYNLLHQLAIVNNLKEITDLKFLNKSSLRAQSEKILKLESPESYQIYLNKKMNGKYGDIHGSFYR